MSYISRLKETTKIDLGDDYFVNVRTRMTFEESLALEGSDDPKNILNLLAKVITEWNLDNDEAVLPITAENIGLLATKDLISVINVIKQSVEVEAKKE
jgi:hypothetical protein